MHLRRYDQWLARAYFLAVANQYFAHDAAFLVLHRLAVEFDLELSRPNHGARDRRDDGPRQYQPGDNRKRRQCTKCLFLEFRMRALGEFVDPRTV